MQNDLATHWRRFLIILAVLASVAALIDLVRRDWVPAASSLCLLAGAIAFERALHYHSARWRTIAWVSLVLAVALQTARIAMA